MPIRKSSTPAAGISINGGGSANAAAVLKILEKVALAATANGREGVAIEAVKALSDIGSIKNLTIANNHIQLGAR